MSMQRRREFAEAGQLVEPRTAFFRESLSFATSGEVRTKQQFVQECDINNILRRYRATGLIRQLPNAPLYGDWSAIPEYQDALNTVIRAEQMFMALPSDLRTRFDNDPQKFLDFVHDDANAEEVYKLGLAKRPDPTDTDRIVEAVTASKPATSEPASSGATPNPTK